MTETTEAKDGERCQFKRCRQPAVLWHWKMGLMCQEHWDAYAKEAEVTDYTKGTLWERTGAKIDWEKVDSPCKITNSPEPNDPS